MLEWLRRGLQPRERHGHHVVVRAANVGGADRRREQPGGIEQRRLLAHRHEADDEVPLERELPHEAEQVRFAGPEIRPRPDFPRPAAPSSRSTAQRSSEVEKAIDQRSVSLAQKAYGRPVGNPGAQSFNRAARFDRRTLVHHAASDSACRPDSNRTRLASGLSRPAARTSSHTRIFSAS